MAGRPRIEGFENAVNPQSSCHLFTLPAEIRNEIYLLALGPFGHREYSDVDMLPLTKFPPQPRVSSSTALLQTCRLIFAEAGAIPFGLLPLDIYFFQIDMYARAYGGHVSDHLRGSYFYDFAKHLSLQRRKSIRRMRIKVFNLEQTCQVLKILHRFPGLKHVEILECFFDQYTQQNVPPYRVDPARLRKIFEGERTFLRKALKRTPPSLTRFEYRYFLSQGRMPDCVYSDGPSLQQLRELAEDITKFITEASQVPVSVESS